MKETLDRNMDWKLKVWERERKRRIGILKG
jgi:hypothetical protein